MPALRSGADRCVLRAGANTIGGRGEGALPVPALAWQPPVATITVQPQGPVLIQRTTAAVVVRVNDEPLGIAPAELRHGAHIDFAGCRLTFDAESSPPEGEREGEGDSFRAAPEAPITASFGRAAPVAPAPTYRLVHAASGGAVPLAARKVVVGRDEASDVRLEGEGVSRRHCSIAPVPGGYLLRDESSNGTLVNGIRISRTHILEDGDVIRVHEDELRFEQVGASAREGDFGDAGVRAATALLDLSRLRDGHAAEERRTPVAATLEIVGGPFTGAAFQLERPVCAIGRAAENDVRLRHESVSASHATLLRKGATWYVVDLRSANGTFVDGYRIAGERQLPSGSTLRLGAVELLFRCQAAPGAEMPDRPDRAGILAMLAERWHRLFPRPFVTG